MCVRFFEESITGKEALELAGVDAVFADFGGSRGSAVCSLCGEGCPPDSSCLTCQEPKYWAYYRAVDGKSSLTYSNVGPSQTTVRDGDIEAWRWGTGSAPAYVGIATVCDGAPAPAPTSTTAATSAPNGPGTTTSTLRTSTTTVGADATDHTGGDDRAGARSHGPAGLGRRDTITRCRRRDTDDRR